MEAWFPGTSENLTWLFSKIFTSRELTSCRSCSGLYVPTLNNICWIRCSQFIATIAVPLLIKAKRKNIRAHWYRIIILFLIIDVEGIKYVINFDYPNSSEDYIHRIGRTGRSDTTGTSYAFFTPNNFKQARDLIAVLKEANQMINPKLAEMANRSDGYGGGKSGRWGYRNNYRGGRENTGPRQTRFGGGRGGGGRQNGYANGGY